MLTAKHTASLPSSTWTELMAQLLNKGGVASRKPE
jgi:hypothetical protein